MNRLNKTVSAVFLYCRFSLFLNVPFFPKVTKAVVVPRRVGNTSPLTLI